MVNVSTKHSIGYTGNGFYRSKDPTNSITVLKEHTDYTINRKNTISTHINTMCTRTACSRNDDVIMTQCYYLPHSSALTNSSSVKLSIRAASRCIYSQHTDRLLIHLPERMTSSPALKGDADN